MKIKKLYSFNHQIGHQWIFVKNVGGHYNVYLDPKCKIKLNVPDCIILCLYLTENDAKIGNIVGSISQYDNINYINFYSKGVL